MIAWDILILKSSADNGSIAWTHLNSQLGAGQGNYNIGGFGIIFKLENTKLFFNKKEYKNIANTKNIKFLVKNNKTAFISKIVSNKNE